MNSLSKSPEKTMFLLKKNLGKLLIEKKLLKISIIVSIIIIIFAYLIYKFLTNFFA